jgi:DNA-binding response OmpR family regulator
MSADGTATQVESTIPRLLVVDDDVIQRTIISKIGTQAGYEVAGAASFQEAKKLMAEQQFDCVTLDLSLGEQSGVLLLHAMVDTNNRVPVFIISGAEEHILASTLRIARGLALDAQLINKPLKLVELREALTQKRVGIVATRGINAHYQRIRGGVGS